VGEAPTEIPSHDLSFMLLDNDVVANIEPQASAFSWRFGGKEGVKDF
jgi:hypothetical protein